MSAVSPRRARVAAVPGRLAGRTTGALRRTPLPLAIILALALVHATAWVVVTAPWNGPDEVAHFAYAEQLARTGHAPQRNDGTGSQSSAQNVALFQLNLFPIRLQPGGRPNYSALDRTKTTLGTLPAATYRNGSGPNSAANYPPLYYAYEAVAYTVSPFRSELGRLFTMRFATVLLFLATVALAWLIAAELLAAAWAPALAAALVALHPKMGFEAAIVNPDMMLVVLSTGALLAAIRVVRRGVTPWAAGALVACTCAAVLTHPRGYFLPPFAVIALLLALTRTRLRRVHAVAAAAVAVVLVGAVAAAMLWTRAHTGGPGGAGSGNPVGAISPRQFVSYLWQFYLPKLSFMDPKVGPSFYGYRQVYIESFFGSFASLSVDYRPLFYDLLQVAVAVGLAALYTTVVVRWRVVLAAWRVVALAVVFFGGLMALLHIVSYSSLRGAGATDPVLTGRYLLPAIALYGTTAAWVASSLPRRVRGVAIGVLLGAAALVAVGGVGLSLERFYV